MITHHQDVESLTHHAIKKFHAQLFLAACPVGKFGSTAQKMRVIQQVQNHTLITSNAFYLLLHAPLARLRQPQGPRPMLAQSLPQTFIKAGISRIIDLHIVERPAARRHVIGEMPHR